jgi:tRNA (guanine-N7-)-methyltransferase
MPDVADNDHHRPIRSYVLRQGRLSNAQARALEEVGPKLTLPFDKAPLDWAHVFGRSAPVVCEIGFGMGESTAAIAAMKPDIDFLGLEVHSPGVGALLKLCEQRALTNVRVIQHDAIEVMNHMIADTSLAGFHVFFPDPWPKKRHHKRRLIQPDVVALLARKLASDGYLHLATDWEDYAVQMLAVLSAEPLLVNTAAGFAPRPDYRGITSFEKKGVAKGHGVWDLLFRRA